MIEKIINDAICNLQAMGVEPTYIQLNDEDYETFENEMNSKFSVIAGDKFNPKGQITKYMWLDVERSHTQSVIGELKRKEWWLCEVKIFNIRTLEQIDYPSFLFNNLIIK